MLHVDVPTLPEIRALIQTRADACVSIYLPTTPQTQHVTASRILFGNLTRTALTQLDASGFDKRRGAALEDTLITLSKATKALFHERVGQHRAITDLRAVAPGTVDETGGSISLATEAGATSCGVIDKIAGRAILAGGLVLAVRRAVMPDGAPVAAILCYTV